MNFSNQNLDNLQQQNGVNTSTDVTDSSQETGNSTESAEYENLTADMNPMPGFSSGVVSYRRDYVNTRPSRNSWYDRLHLIRPQAIQWLRNAWGDVDQFGRHVYDTMGRVRQVFVPYDKFDGRSDAAGSGIELDSLTYNTLERLSVVTQTALEHF